MKSLDTHLGALLEHLYPSANIGKDIIVQDDGNGQFIAEWNIADTQPTTEELETALAAFDSNKVYEEKQVMKARKHAYPKVGDQLDAILKQLKSLSDSEQITLVTEMSDIINEWQQVKTDNPKPE